MHQSEILCQQLFSTVGGYPQFMLQSKFLSQLVEIFRNPFYISSSIGPLLCVVGRLCQTDNSLHFGTLFVNFHSWNMIPLLPSIKFMGRREEMREISKVILRISNISINPDETVLIDSLAFCFGKRKEGRFAILFFPRNYIIFLELFLKILRNRFRAAIGTHNPISSAITFGLIDDLILWKRILNLLHQDIKYYISKFLQKKINR